MKEKTVTVKTFRDFCINKCRFRGSECQLPEKEVQICPLVAFMESIGFTNYELWN